MFGWLKKKKADREYLDKIKKPEYYVNAMENDVRFYHVIDKTKCRITNIDRWYGQEDCNITMECRVGYLSFKYRVSSLEIPLMFKEII